mmetsp:Transcript_25410/g.41315  ORF Transcript_25410/g.41315 Transcript_25410/m.41315 type:complete len:232 (+) Transcript_25410:438-1133(+)
MSHQYKQAEKVYVRERTSVGIQWGFVAILHLRARCAGRPAGPRPGPGGLPGVDRGHQVVQQPVQSAAGEMGGHETEVHREELQGGPGRRLGQPVHVALEDVVELGPVGHQQLLAGRVPVQGGGRHGRPQRRRGVARQLSPHLLVLRPIQQPLLFGPPLRLQPLPLRLLQSEPFLLGPPLCLLPLPLRVLQSEPFLLGPPLCLLPLLLCPFQSKSLLLSPPLCLQPFLLRPL